MKRKNQAKTFIEPEKDKNNEEIRLNKYIASAGICSRRDADELIKDGKVRINGEVATEMGYKVKPEDVISLNGKEISPRQNKVYILLNKPKGFITTTEDPMERKTVMELVANATEERIYPVGRLDRNTTGLLLLTNDGDLTQIMMHPSNQVRKIYSATLDKPLSTTDLNKIKNGIMLDDGVMKADEVAFINNQDPKEIGVEIHSGKNRVVRRIFEALGYEVLKLDRVMLAILTKKDLPRGKWRHLSPREVSLLKATLQRKKA